VRDGAPLEFKYVKDDQPWEFTPNRVLQPSPGEQVQPADVFNQDDATVALRREVLAADDRLFSERLVFP
jgi:hypothetical protein